MRFSLSALMLLVLLLAIGCAGWNFGIWTSTKFLSNLGSQIILATMAYLGLLTVAVLWIGKGKVMPFIVLGFVANVVAIAAFWGADVLGRHPQLIPFTLPLAALAGGLRLAWDQELRWPLRILPVANAMFATGWTAAMLVQLK